MIIYVLFFLALVGAQAQVVLVDDPNVASTDEYLTGTLSLTEGYYYNCVDGNQFNLALVRNDFIQIYSNMMTCSGLDLEEVADDFFSNPSGYSSTLITDIATLDATVNDDGDVFINGHATTFLEVSTDRVYKPFHPSGDNYAYPDTITGLNFIATTTIDSESVTVAFGEHSQHGLALAMTIGSTYSTVNSGYSPSAGLFVFNVNIFGSNETILVEMDSTGSSGITVKRQSIDYQFDLDEITPYAGNYNVFSLDIDSSSLSFGPSMGEYRMTDDLSYGSDDLLALSLSRWSRYIPDPTTQSVKLYQLSQDNLVDVQTNYKLSADKKVVYYPVTIPGTFGLKDTWNTTNIYEKNITFIPVVIKFNDDPIYCIEDDCRKVGSSMEELSLDSVSSYDSLQLDGAWHQRPGFPDTHTWKFITETSTLVIKTEVDGTANSAQIRKLILPLCDTDISD